MSENTLLQITKEYQHIESKLLEAGGEMTPDLETWLEEINSKLVTKIDACVYVLERLKAGETYFKAKAQQWLEAARLHSSAEARLKARIKFCMRELETKEIAGDDSSFKLSGGRYRTFVKDPSLLPNEFWKEVVERVPDRELIESAIENGIEVPGVQREEILSLRITQRKK